MALRCLVRTEKRLLKDPKIVENYINFMTKLFQDGHVVVLKPNEIKGVEGQIWYQCHHCVHTSGKYRIVFDCTAQYDGISFNDKD